MAIGTPVDAFVYPDAKHKSSFQLTGAACIGGGGGGGLIIIFSGLIDVFPDGGNHLHTPLKRSYVFTGTLRTCRRRKFKVDLE